MEWKSGIFPNFWANIFKQIQNRLKLQGASKQPSPVHYHHLSSTSSLLQFASNLTTFIQWFWATNSYRRHICSDRFWHASNLAKWSAKNRIPPLNQKTVVSFHGLDLKPNLTRRLKMSCILTSLQQNARLASVSHENPTILFGLLPSLFRRQCELTICNAAPKTLTSTRKRR